ncbi:hypothetical protein BDV19DRAFT_364791 [Aspergillus venezuelensis]
MPTRAPQPENNEDIPDKAHVCADLEEPFMLTVRYLGGEAGVKVIWWFVACLEAECGDLTLASRGMLTSRLNSLSVRRC